MTEQIGGIMRRSLAGQEHWKRSKRYPEFEVSNLGKVRRVGERSHIEPYKTSNGMLRVDLVTVNGKAQVQVANLVAEAFIGERVHGHQKVVHKNGNLSDCTAYNLEYVAYKRPPQSYRKDTPVAEIAPDANALATELAQAGIEPQYVVLDVGSLAMTASLEMAYGIAGIQGLDIYRLKKRGSGNMTVWTLGDKVE